MERTEIKKQLQAIHRGMGAWGQAKEKVALVKEQARKLWEAHADVIRELLNEMDAKFSRWFMAVVTPRAPKTAPAGTAKVAAITTESAVKFLLEHGYTLLKNGNIAPPK